MQPLVFCGPVFIGSQPAPDGARVEALVGGTACGGTTTRDGLFFLDLPLGYCPKSLTEELTLTVNGKPAQTIRGYGREQYIVLRVD